MSVGYEGRSVDELADALVEAGVSVLVDVRENAISRKRGLSKRALAEKLESRGTTSTPAGRWPSRTATFDRWATSSPVRSALQPLLPDMRAGELGDQVRAVLRSYTLLAAALAAIHHHQRGTQYPRGDRDADDEAKPSSARLARRAGVPADRVLGR